MAKDNEPTWEPKIVREDNTPSSHLEVNEKKRKRRLFKRLLFIIFSFTLIIAVTLYFLSPYSKLAKVTVKGNHEVTTNEVLNKADFKIGDSLWGQVFSKEKKEETLLENSRLKKVAIHFVPLNKLEIQVTEFKTLGLLLKEEHYYPILENGQVLENSVSNQNDLPILQNFSDTALMMATLKEYGKLSESIQKGISDISYTGTKTNRRQVTLLMTDGNTVIGQIPTLGKSLKKYPQVASQMTEKGIIDMEAGIFSYPYPTESSEEETENSTEISQES